MSDAAVDAAADGAAEAMETVATTTTTLAINVMCTTIIPINGISS